jgi:hypothetical protein
VCNKATHALLGSLYRDGDGKMAFPAVPASADHLQVTSREAIAVSSKREGLYLDRGGISSDAVVPLEQAGIPGIYIHDIPGGAWQGIFQ